MERNPSPPLLLTPGRIGSVEIRNRLIVPSMCLYFSNQAGDVTDKMAAFFTNRAKSGIGAFIIPANPHGEDKLARGSLADDTRIEQWKPLLDALHAEGSRAFCQIHPSGIQFGRSGFEDESSPFLLTTAELAELIESYALGALRAKRAGFDGVEIHGAHGHEIALLLSELLNNRQDRYGGSLENCARSVTEMIRRMKELCGEDFPVILRISGEERIKGGRAISGSVEICRLAEQAGADAIHVSAGMPESEEWECPPSEIEQGHLAPLGRALKASLKIPVIVVGRIVDWQVGERMISAGDADFIAVARANLADAGWAESIPSAPAAAVAPIRRCIGCNQGCRTRREQHKSAAACLQNPLLGIEESVRIEQDMTDRDIVIIGGGVAGLEAANVLSKRGARVTLFEANDHLGGSFFWASKAPGKEPYLNVIRYYEELLPQQGVRFVLGRRLSSLPGRWDAVLLATGGRAICPPIDIEEGITVQSALDFIQLADFTAEQYLIIGDGIIGYEIADMVTERGKKAIVIGNDAREQTATLGVARWHFMRERLEKGGAVILRQGTVTRIAAGLVTFVDEAQRERSLDIRPPFRSVMACGYRAASQEELAPFAAGGVPLFVVGSAERAGDAMDAIHGAFAKCIALTLD